MILVSIPLFVVYFGVAYAVWNENYQNYLNASSSASKKRRLRLAWLAPIWPMRAVWLVFRYGLISGCALLIEKVANLGPYWREAWGPVEPKRVPKHPKPNPNRTAWENYRKERCDK